MINTKNILVSTTSTIDGIEVIQFLKPVSAHVVAGTNLFSDFFASFSDVFGGRSQAYQKQLASLYNEAIDGLKIAAYELGGNCIIGLHVDLDEISGKGKSMFMVTAIGTAVIVEDTNKRKQSINTNEGFKNISIDKIKIFQRKNEILAKTKVVNAYFDEAAWEFVTENQVSEVYDFVMQHLKSRITFAEVRDSNYKQVLSYVDGLPEEKKTTLLYESILKEENDAMSLRLCSMIEDLQLLDLDFVTQILNSTDFSIQKNGLRIVTYDKAFYNKEDIGKLHSLISLVKESFPERGIRSMKKQLLSSKEKEVWTCECKASSEIGKPCGNCKKDIYGFKEAEITPSKAITILEEKINLISSFI